MALCAKVVNFIWLLSMQDVNQRVDICQIAIVQLDAFECICNNCIFPIWRSVEKEKKSMVIIIIMMMMLLMLLLLLFFLHKNGKSKYVTCTNVDLH